MKTFSKYLLLGALCAGFLTGCANDDDYDAPNMGCINPGLTANKTVESLIAQATETPTLYTADDIIEAYITSSDERGAFFKVVSLQTLPPANSGIQPVAFSIAIDRPGLFTEGFVPGVKVSVKLKDLYYAIDFESLEVGTLFEGQVGRISEQTFKNHVFINTCEKVEEAQLVTVMTIDEALNDANINRLIELKDVQFVEASFDQPLYNENASTAVNGDNPQTIGGATNHILQDITGHKIVFRTSSFANFSGMMVPEGSGTVRGVLTKFLDTYQFVARYETDLKLTGERFIPAELSDSALGGTDIQYLGSFSENFESYAVNEDEFPKYVNDNAVGTRYWQVKSFSNNKYIEMTSFNGANNPGAEAKTYLFVPVNLSDANTIAFDYKVRFMAGQSLKVYIAEEGEYSPGMEFDASIFTDITSQFGITYPASGQSQANFVNAPAYSIPAGLTGNGFIVFEYAGGGTVTTTIQLDNIAVN